MENEYYKKISGNMTDEKILNSAIDFTGKEKSLLEKYFPITLSFHGYKYRYIRIRERRAFDFIVSLKDEWYILYDSCGNTYGGINYLCDQMDGLIKCMEDIWIIKPSNNGR